MQLFPGQPSSGKALSERSRAPSRDRSAELSLLDLELLQGAPERRTVLVGEFHQTPRVRRMEQVSVLLGVFERVLFLPAQLGEGLGVWDRPRNTYTTHDF